MERRVINPSAKPGSLYNACVNQIVSEPIRKPVLQQKIFKEKAKCRIINGNASETNDLLRWIGVEDELLLSLLTASTKREGIAAILNYQGRIDQNTRIMHYYWKRRTDTDTSTSNNLSIPKTDNQKLGNATHVMISVDYGIDLLIIFQLPQQHESVELIDQALDTICCSWRELRKIERHKENVEQVLKQVKNIHVCSNLTGLNGETTISNILQLVKKAWEKSGNNRPIKCCLEPIKESNTTSIQESRRFHLLNSRNLDSILHIILPLRRSLQHAEVSVNETGQIHLSSNARENLESADTLFRSIKNKFIQQMKMLGNAIHEAHRGLESSSKIDEMLKSIEFRALIEDIQKLESLLRSRNFSEQKTFSKSKDHIGIVKTGNNLNQVIATSNHSDADVPMVASNSRNTSIYQQHDNHRIPPRKTDCHGDPSLSKTKRSTGLDDETRRNVQHSTSHESVKDGNTKKMESSEVFGAASHMPNDQFDTINILLLGESGVGKSTFINAFANYLTFENLQQAQNSEPIVVMPVSFVLTTGPHFEERIVTFGEYDATKNEHFNNQGQSVTQRCRSYTFDLPSNDKRHMRIIDTPGFGDTRGIDQDQINIEHILQYISHLSHLDAICFLLKPNESRMNTSFRLCFNQLFSLLGQTAYPNLIFCFTNGRSTFYNPGNTAPLIEKMIAEFDHSNLIKFQKQHIFCFDNEAFRFLLARRNSIDFTNEEQKEYEKSWTISVNESKRLTKYIEENLTMFRMDDDTWQSVKHAQFQIMSLVRPILETMRNQLRNLILKSKNELNHCITISASPGNGEASYCSSCFSTEEVGPFLVRVDEPHYISDECSTCQCLPNVHRPLVYHIEYHWITRSIAASQSELESLLNELCASSAAMGRFLSTSHHSTNEDPFINGLTQMIDEEIIMAERGKSKTLNQSMARMLSKLLENYEWMLADFQTKEKYNGSKNLSEIYAKIKQVKNYPMVQEQMIALKKAEKRMLEETERSVHCI